ncbi:enoyl-CoA hydratase/isomerase family protein [Mesorhizobium sp. BR1-1-9]|uniref:enoyl-CoA hydratase/isomerase family protein n=1 Tax=Mesorhizobium sp. BR1-1-9 TaxID=2876646 RepID=UPI001CD0A4DD|nr:enoyl-CoA hydratase/isomerase family protein [Mesorhizobium sp. BR1-1-9]MBZ9870407.1 enoyl-CoA hydratase/isomerase family protein [Mesorhizobium sp. BR1-1-9]
MSGRNNASIQSARQGQAGRITLNEPASLNALSPAMVGALGAQLAAWRDDPAVKWVVIDGAGDKAFSAGADVREMWRHAVAREYAEIDRYFAQEYAIDLMLAEYPKPCITLVDGICFGGGMGLAVHARYSLVTETASFSMPETLIGFFPDAGATWFLPRLPHPLGIYLGLTGARITGADAVRLGLASHFVPHSRFKTVVSEIVTIGPERLATVDFPVPAFSLAAQETQIRRCFGSDSLEAIFARLDEDQSEWAKRTRQTLAGRSPASLKWAFQSLRRPGKGLAECLQNELELAAVSARHPDFEEGVRAALIDKDKSPRWHTIGR